MQYSIAYTRTFIKLQLRFITRNTNEMQSKLIKINIAITIKSKIQQKCEKSFMKNENYYSNTHEILWFFRKP